MEVKIDPEAFFSMSLNSSDSTSKGSRDTMRGNVEDVTVESKHGALFERRKDGCSVRR
jgi:hypothetical protein